MAQEVCPVCGGSGWKIVEREDVSGAERCDCALESRTMRLEEQAGIPPLYQKASFDNFSTATKDNEMARRELADIRRMALTFAHEFPLDSRPGLLLIGEPLHHCQRLSRAVFRLSESAGSHSLRL
jgi:DNA replication protein DnaC